MSAGVVARYAFNSSFTWTEELGSWVFVWLTFVGVAAGHRGDQHIALELFGPPTTSRSSKLRQIVVSLVVAYTTLWLLQGGADLVRNIGGRSTALQWPNAVKYAVVPAACIVSMAYLVLADATLSGMLRASLVLVAAYLTLGPMQTLLGMLISGASPSVVMSAAFAAALVAGVPVAFSMLFGVFVAALSANLLPVPAVVHTVVSGASSFVLLAIPFFLTVGYLMNSGGLSARVIDLASALVGHFRGGLAQANVVHSALLGGVCGSAGADAASTTKILVPEMIRRGYSPPFACAVTAVGSILPACFPPSIALLVYAAVAEVSIAQLFTAGIVPGLLLCGFMMLTVYWVASTRHYEPPRARASLRAIFHAFLNAMPVGILAIAILGMLRFGIATATEVGAIAVLWVFVLGKFAYGKMSWLQAYRDLQESAIQSALIGFLIAVSAPFAWVLIAEGAPKQLIDWSTQFFSQPWQLLLLLNVLMLVAGTVLELIPMILIMVPLFVPVLTSFGADPIQIGIVIVINGLLGSLTPPVGVLVFITASIAKVPAGAIFRECNPFLVSCGVGLLLITFVPAISLTLWRLIS